ncbi:hypothetical protein ILYODFUR_004263 [Ilyodon furcidens]|uniref:Uncharacterized protein n=1 Tax=Ilyodon furcidens TaxID=33524 RepID=A0ABV0UQ33_9TELE
MSRSGSNHTWVWKLIQENVIYHRSASSTSLMVPPAGQTTMGFRACSRSAPHLWNALPPDIRNASALSLFSNPD